MSESVRERLTAAGLREQEGEKYMLSTLTDLRVELLHPFQDKRGDWSSLWEHGPLDKERLLELLSA